MPELMFGLKFAHNGIGLRRCASLNSKSKIRIPKYLQASAMWVRRALQRVEPRAATRINAAMRGPCVRCCYSSGIIQNISLAMDGEGDFHI